MRQILGITLFLLGVGLLMCQWEGQADRTAIGAQEVRWVRTADGWERTDTWEPAISSPPDLHPFVVAAGQGLLSVFALVAFPSRKDAGCGVQGAG